MFSWIIHNTPLLYLTQSLWRDEVFSLYVAKMPILDYFTKLSFEPPLYYILLHLWTSLFGISELAGRSFSLLGYCLAVIVVIFWSTKLFHNHWLSKFFPVIFATNPMLVYYACEIRTYGWYTFFTTLTFYAYNIKSRNLLLIGLIGGFYNHVYFIWVPFILFVHFIFSQRDILQKGIKSTVNFIKTNAILHAFSISFIAMLPWLIKIAFDAVKLKNSWFFPVDFQLFKSAIGNLYFGYEGTPWYGWYITQWISVLLLFIISFLLRTKKGRSEYGYLALSAFVPLTIVLLISYFFKPLYVNRYLIFVTVSLLILVGLGIGAMKNKYAQIFTVSLILSSHFLFLIWFPNQIKKTDFRKTLYEVSRQMRPQDVIYATSSLSLFESLYYAKDPSRVFLYNPENQPFPWYVGDIIVNPNIMATELPEYPNRAFLVSPDGTYEVVAHQIISTDNQKK